MTLEAWPGLLFVVGCIALSIVIEKLIAKVFPA